MTSRPNQPTPNSARRARLIDRSGGDDENELEDDDIEETDDDMAASG